MQPRRDEHPDKDMERQQPQTDTARPMLEALEERFFLSVTLNPKLKKLFVVGTNKNDVIVIQRDSEIPERIAISINGDVTVREWEKFKRVEIHGNKGNDRIIVDDSYGQIPTSRIMQIFGESGNDTLTGCMNADEIDGGGDNDIIRGRDGNDTITGDAGNDRVFGGDGADTITGADGDDTITGGLGSDDLAGDNGFDSVSGNEGNDTIHGGASRDKLYGNDGDDDLFGDGGNDRILDGPGNDLITP
jgi:Ca2+-binding RTX toxin-like protein